MTGLDFYGNSKSKPRAKWWGYVRRVLYEYPRMRAQLDEMQAGATSTTAGYGAVAAHSAPGRPVERAAIVTLPATEQRELEAVEAAVRETRQLRDGETRLRIIDMVFWRRSHTLSGAAMAENVNYWTAQKKANQFIRMVGRNMGLK